MEEADVGEKCSVSLKEAETLWLQRSGVAFQTGDIWTWLWRPLKPSSLNTEEQEMMVLLETSPGGASPEKWGFFW